MKNDFKSFLAVEFSNYLQLLLSAGRSTHNHEIMLRSLDSFLLQNHTFEKCLSESIINQWLSTICGTSANKVSYIARYRGLSKYLRSILHTKASQTRSCDMILPVATHSLKR